MTVYCASSRSSLRAATHSAPSEGLTRWRIQILSDERVSVVPGVYYVGDPVRVFGDDDDRWDDLMNEVGGFQGQPIGYSDDIEVLAFPTGKPEGWFECDQGEVPVHAGLGQPVFSLLARVVVGVNVADISVYRHYQLISLDGQIDGRRDGCTRSR
jgi:hypothetical protein